MTESDVCDFDKPLFSLPVTGVSKLNPELSRFLGLIYLRGVAKGMVTGMVKGMEIAGRAQSPSVMEQSARGTRELYITTTSSPRDSGQIIRERVRGALSSVPKVEHICLKKEANVYHVWTIVREKNDLVDEAIYSRELEIMDSFDEVPFDFLVIHRGERELVDLIPDGGQIIYAKP
jgi:hypothetical protein